MRETNSIIRNADPGGAQALHIEIRMAIVGSADGHSQRMNSHGAAMRPDDSFRGIKGHRNLTSMARSRPCIIGERRRVRVKLMPMKEHAVSLSIAPARVSCMKQSMRQYMSGQSYCVEFQTALIRGPAEPAKLRFRDDFDVNTVQSGNLTVSPV
ncbi:MAG: hypothetical protein ACR2PI_02485 [Hyphomicrobiaceae bacterium]